MAFYTSCQTQFFAHRGLRGLYPENSIQGIRNALKSGMDGVEFDVVVNREKKLVLSHESFFRKSICTLNGKSNFNKRSHSIYRMTQKEIECFDCGSRGNRKFKQQQKNVVHKPLLHDLIDQVDFENKTILLEIKSRPNGYNRSQPSALEFAQIVFDEIQNSNLSNQLIVMSFDAQILNAYHALDPKSRIIYLKFLPFFYLKKQVSRLDFKPYAFGIYHKATSKKSIKKLKELDIKTFCWTVNSKRKINKLIRLEVDGIISDYPGPDKKD